MNTILDKTADLADSIRNSREYRRYLELRERIQSSPASYELLKQYRQIQFVMELSSMAGEVDEDTENAMEALCLIMQDDPQINEYLTAEYNFTRLMQDVQRVLVQDMDVFNADSDVESDLYLN